MEKLIRAIAYKMTGNCSHTADIVQDIQLKLLTHQPEMQDEKNYIIRMTVNHCLNFLKKENQLSYPDICLPEPIPSGMESNFISDYETTDHLNYEMIRLLNSLSPSERAVFILKKAFDYRHQEIADAIGISIDNSRQLLKRAKESLKQAKHQVGIAEKQLELAAQYVGLIQTGDLEGLIALFNEDIAVLGDGGGKVFAAKIPILGREKAARFITNIASKFDLAIHVELGLILQQPAILLFLDKQCIAVQILSIEQGKIVRVFSQINPDKLKLFHTN